MFQKKSNTTNDPVNKNTATEIEAFPIYTMKRDLKNIADPNFNINSSFDETIAQKETSKRLLAQEKNNPFLNATTPADNIPIKKIIPIKPLAKSTSKEKNIIIRQIDPIKRNPNALISKKELLPIQPLPIQRAIKSSDEKDLNLNAVEQLKESSLGIAKRKEHSIILEKNTPEKEKRSSAFQSEPQNLNSQLAERIQSPNLAKQEDLLFEKRKASLENELTLKEKELSDKKTSIRNADAQLKELENKKQALNSYIIKEETRINEEKKYFNSILQKKEISPDQIYAPPKQFNQNNMLEREKQQPAEQNNDSSIQDASFHTMKDDLRNVNNVSFDNGLRTETTPAIETISDSQTNLGPFSAQEKWINKKSTEPIQTHGLGKVIVSAISIFVFLILSAGGYYFWMTREMDTNKKIALPNEEPIETPIEIPIVSPTFSTQNSNYLTLNNDINLLDKTMLKETLTSYASKVSQMSPGSLVEFIITDKSNNPVPFQIFAEKLGVTFSSDILSQLGPDFSLYIYSYGDKTRLGLSVSSKDSQNILAILAKNEKGLLEGLTPIYPDTISYTLTENAFKENVYNGTMFRYINITTPEDLAIDYGMYNNQLLIGTTKASFFSILDYQVKKSLLTN